MYRQLKESYVHSHRNSQYFLQVSCGDDVHHGREGVSVRRPVEEDSMNDSYGTTDTARREPTPSSSANLPLDEIDETDIRILVPYDWDNNDGETLVGIGPFPSRIARKSTPYAAAEPPRKSAPHAAAEPLRKSAPKTAAEPPRSVQPISVQPTSESPGAWGSDDEVIPET